jgi:anti-sigma factor RsiW
MGAKRKITCQNFLDEMSDYIDGSLGDELRVSIEAHLAKCPNCWVVFDETRKTVAIFQSMECLPLPKQVHDRLLEALERNWKKA